MVKIEFDPKKNTTNKTKHGLCFKDIHHLDWDTALVIEDERFDYGEVRYRAFVCDMDGIPYSVAFTLRQNAMRIL